jgi:hypothetical protein
MRSHMVWSNRVDVHANRSPHAGIHYRHGVAGWRDRGISSGRRRGWDLDVFMRTLLTVEGSSKLRLGIEADGPYGGTRERIRRWP